MKSKKSMSISTAKGVTKLTVEEEDGVITKVRPISKEEIVEEEIETTMLGCSKQSAHFLQPLVQEVLDDVSAVFQSNLKDIALSSIGLTNKWGKWELDTYGDKMSALEDFVNKTSKELLKQVDVKSVSSLISDKEMQQIRKVISRCVVETVKDHLHCIVQEKTVSLLKEMVDEELSKSKESIGAAIKNMLRDKK